MTDKTVPRFTKSTKPYNAGEIAGFAPAEAADFVARGVAEPYAPDAVATAEATDEKAAPDATTKPAPGGKTKGL